MNERHYTYILASKRNGALYVGVTTNLVETVLDHKCNMIVGITSQYAIHQLVFFERHKDAGSALLREQAIRQMHRIWKLDLIEQNNPDWRDLYAEITDSAVLPEPCHPAA
ncbi:MAG: GIY-YIG nuclease family protein [Gammaproteobacteria bacterium]|nr:GIY-YIG nuclease family protein [Gammaproteobacteria bacterium]